MYGGDKLNRLHKILKFEVGEGHSGLTLGWKGFDSSIPPFLIKKAFAIVWSIYRFENKRLERHMRTLFDFIIEYFINTPIMLGDGTLYWKSHGIPSGSGFT